MKPINFSALPLRTRTLMLVDLPPATQKLDQAPPCFICPSFPLPAPLAAEEEPIADVVTPELTDPRSTWTPVSGANAIWAQPVRSFG
jgi:hypothetical protein